MNPDNPGGSETEIGELRRRVERLEDALTRQGILDPRWVRSESASTAARETAPVKPETPAASAQLPTEPVQAQADARTAPWVPAAGGPRVSTPMFQSIDRVKESRRPGEERSLESRIGSQWFNRIGILAVLIGMAWFLKFAFDNHWIGPAGRVLIGLVAGAALIAWSERFRAKGYAAFSYSLKALGSGILYLSLWAAFSVYQLLPGTAAFGAMVAVTAFNAFLAWMQDSELLAVYAIAGGFSTPLLVSTGENHEVALFSYMLLLDVAVLVLVALRPWSRLLFGAFTGTVLYAVAWAAEFYSRGQVERTAIFFACFYLVFALAPRLVLIGGAEEQDSETRGTAWDGLVTVAMPPLTAAIGFLAFYGLLDSIGAEWAHPWLAVAFAAFYLVLLRMPASGRWRRATALASHLHLATAVVFLTIAIPLKASGRWITIGWLAEGAALIWVARRTQSLLLRALAEICLVLALAALVTVNPPASLTPVFNQRFAAYVVAIAAFAIVAWLAAHAEAEEHRDAVLSWPIIAAISGLLINALILAAIALEIHAYWWSVRWNGQWEQYDAFRMDAQFTYSAFFMAFGAILLALGFSRRLAFLRWQALILLAVSIGKVFVVDMSELSQGFRILSFLGLGALLLVVSFVYQRDWFNLRQRGDGAS
ncbi:MAG TPA: DUF2339 domain-containing protein [Terracidiphilus sp.]|nr:DUF2339 domain-containing protein [Terracidiphilus sp.]HKF49348.1 DUF2339 domain-containing protein [Terracidiphilus sp.]